MSKRCLIETRKESAFKEQLKVCPVCKSVSFADMDTCFSCLYHFDEEEMTLRYKSDLESVSDMDDRIQSEGNNANFAKEVFVVEGIEKASYENNALQASLGKVSFIDRGFEISIAVRPLNN